MEDKSHMKEEFSKRLIKFTIDIIRFVDRYSSHRTLAPIFRQLVRSASSIGANVTEAQGSASKKEFKNYFHIALKSAKETRYWLIVLREYGGEVGTAVGGLLQEDSEFIKILSSSILTLKSKQ